MKTSTKYLKIFINLLIAIVGILLLCFVVPKLIVFFMPFVIGWIISIIANPMVRFLERKVKIVRKHSSAIIIILVIGLIAGVGYLLIAKTVTEVGNFVNGLPEMYPAIEQDFREIGDNLQGVYNRLPEWMQGAVDEITGNISTYVGDLVGKLGKPTMAAAGNIAKNLPNILVSVIVTLVSAYFFSADREKIYSFMRNAMPSSIQKNLNFVGQKFKEVIGGYIKAQVKIMYVVTVIIFIGLLILRVNYLFLLTIVIAFLDFLPIFGSGTVLLPWALYEILSGEYKMAVGLLILYAITQLVRQVIQPKLVGDSIGMNPFLTLFFIFVGYKVKGFIGMIIGIPLGMIVIALYEMRAFDNWIRYIKIIVNDINNFRKIDDE